MSLNNKYSMPLMIINSELYKNFNFKKHNYILIANILVDFSSVFINVNDCSQNRCHNWKKRIYTYKVKLYPRSQLEPRF